MNLFFFAKKKTLIKGVDLTSKRWKEVVAQLEHTADDMASASTRLSASAEQISKSTAIDAERTSQAASASVEMPQTVNDVARNTTSITTSAAETTEVAKEGEQAVIKSVKEVKEIALLVEKSAGILQSLGEGGGDVEEGGGGVFDGDFFTKHKEAMTMSNLNVLIEKYAAQVKELETRMADTKHKQEIVLEASRLLEQEGLSEGNTRSVGDKKTSL